MPATTITGREAHSTTHLVYGPPSWLLLLAAAAYNLLAGFEGGGNLMASLVAARAFTLLGAALVLFVGAALGPWLVGTAVAHAIVFSVVALPRLGPTVFFGGVVGAVITLGVCWARSLPTSTSLALIGALAGAGLIAAGPQGVEWSQIWKVFAGMLAALGMGAAGGLLAWAGVRTMLQHAGERIPSALRGLQAVTGLLQGFGYGSNDAGKAMGLFALIGAWRASGGPQTLATGHLAVPAWAVWAAIGTFGLGMAVGGARVAHTVGHGLYPVRAGDALAAQLAAGVTVIAASSWGAPVSSTQTATAALIAAGAARRLSLPRWSLVRQMGLTWAITLPLALVCGAMLTAAVRALV